MPTPTPPSQLGNLLRLTPLQSSDLPSHPLLPPTSTPRPALPLFISTLLSQATTFLSPTTFPDDFTHHSTKASQSASENVPVEVHKLDVPASALQGIDWEGGGEGGVRRTKPAEELKTEHWFTRHSRHLNLRSTEGEALKVGGASWREFVFGLRDNHSLNEEAFTPTLYACKPLLNWASEIASLTSELHPYTHVTLSITEMCHAIPAPLSPRCFSVLVLTASLSPTSFIAVTVPIELPANLSYYASGKNVSSETDAQRRKQVVVGAYAAVETVRLEKGADGKEEIDWVMGTASDTRGNLPMAVQKLGLPGAVVKDVGFFLRWIRGVKESEMAGTEL